VWVQYKTHTFIISCTFFLMCEDSTCLFTISAIQLEENESLLEGFEVHDTNCENNYVLNLKVKPFGGPHTNSFYIF
jgi:hypothetical protein